jgi:hypothetical protein
MADELSISYAIDQSSGGAQCKGTSTYEGEDITAYGLSWPEAKTNVISKAKAIKALCPIPPPDTVDLDAP